MKTSLSLSIHVDPPTTNPNPLAIVATNTPASEVVGVEDAGENVAKISGGKTPYSLTVENGSLPPGMTVSTQDNSDGTTDVFVEGTPIQAGDYSFDLVVTDADSGTATLAARRRVA